MPLGLDSPHQTGRSASLESNDTRLCSVKDLLLGDRRSNSIDGVVHATVGKGAYAFDRIAVGSVDTVGCSKSLGKFQLLVIQVHGDDRKRPDDTGRDDGAQSDAADAEHGNRFGDSNFQRIQDRAAPGQYCAANDRCHIGRDVVAQRDHKPLGKNRVFRPRRATCVDGVLTPKGFRTRARRGSFTQIPVHPSGDYVVAFLNMGDILTLGDDNSC